MGPKDHPLPPSLSSLLTPHPNYVLHSCLKVLVNHPFLLKEECFILSFGMNQNYLPVRIF